MMKKFALVLSIVGVLALATGCSDSVDEINDPIEPGIETPADPAPGIGG